MTETRCCPAWDNRRRYCSAGVDGRLEICQLVAHDLIDFAVKGTWIGSGRPHLVPHVNAPAADFPVRRHWRRTILSRI
jgi:acetoacetate decarboxylase